MKFICVSIAGLWVILCGAAVALGQCPTIIEPDHAIALGTYREYASIPTILGAHKRCSRLTITAVNGTVHTALQYLNTITNRMELHTAQTIVDEASDSYYLMGQSPYEYVLAYHLLDVGPDYFIKYSCSPCGFYGTATQPIQPIILVNVSHVDCEMRDKFNRALAKLNLTLDDLTIDEQTDCPTGC